MLKLLVIVLTPVVIVLLICQSLLDSVKFFFSSLKENFSRAIDSYKEYFFGTKAKEESDWWNFS